MSNINTGPININYPTPGVNNNSQGFRDNFNSIKSNLETASTEISDLQNKAIVKSPLTGSTLNNDMNNTLLSNALVQGFRHVTYNIGNNLSGTINIDYTRGDFQYGTITGNTILTFSKWPPAGTYAQIELVFTMGLSTATINFPAQIDSSKTTLENYTNTSPTFTITTPAGETQLHYLISTEDCGTSLTITPVNRPRRAAQLMSGTPVTANFTATGTITASTGSTSVTGSGTLFLTELVSGRVITNSSNVVIGTIASVSSNTSCTLIANAAVAVTGAAYKRQLPIGQQGDTPGTVLTDGTTLYLCYAAYDGTNPIWKKTTLGSY